MKPKEAIKLAAAKRDRDYRWVAPTAGGVGGVSLGIGAGVKAKPIVGRYIDRQTKGATAPLKRLSIQYRRVATDLAHKIDSYEALHTAPRAHKMGITPVIRVKRPLSGVTEKIDLRTEKGIKRGRRLSKHFLRQSATAATEGQQLGNKVIKQISKLHLGSTVAGALGLGALGAYGAHKLINKNK
jgi:hypothetical protein